MPTALENKILSLWVHNLLQMLLSGRATWRGGHGYLGNHREEGLEGTSGSHLFQPSIQGRFCLNHPREMLAALLPALKIFQR